MRFYMTWLALLLLFNPPKAYSQKAFQIESMNHWSQLLQKAQKEKKLILMQFSENCNHCQSQVNNLTSDKSTLKYLKKNFITIQIHRDSDSLAKRLSFKYGLWSNQWAVFVPQGELLFSFATNQTLSNSEFVGILKDINELPFPHRTGFPKGLSFEFTPVIQKMLNGEFYRTDSLETSVKRQLETSDIKSYSWFQVAINFPQWVSMNQLNQVASNVDYYYLLFGSDVVKNFLLIAAKTHPKPSKVPDGNNQLPLK